MPARTTARPVRAAVIAAVAAVLGAVAAAPAAAWRIDLPDTVVVTGGTALLRDVSLTPVPAGAGDLVVHAGGAPNTTVTVSGRLLLRKLVTAGLGGGVTFGGAAQCVLVFAGRELDGETVAGALRRELQALVPLPVPGAPDSWLDVTVPEMRLAAVGDWRVEVRRERPLAPGRNLVPVRLAAGDHRESFTVSVVLHCYDEVARARLTVERDTPLDPGQFTWEWTDLASLDPGTASGRGIIAGASATRRIGAGDLLRLADLRETPVVLAGDPVDLMVVRGQVAVTVRALARQAGCVGQIIPVRNELTGRLVNARVAAPGVVEWRR
jgi:flagella basal body P-ring formation protein FlgA